MNTLSLKENLIILMKRHGNISVTDLAKATGLPQSTLHQLYSGLTTNPRQKTLEILSEFFSVSLPQFMGDEPLPNTLSQALSKDLHINTAPLLAWEDLSLWPNKINFKLKEQIILHNYPETITFALKMTDSSMEPLFPEETILIFDTQKEPKNRDNILIYLAEEKHFAFKRIIVDGANTYTKSLNRELRDLPSIPIRSEDRIIGTLLEARIKF